MTSGSSLSPRFAPAPTHFSIPTLPAPISLLTTILHTTFLSTTSLSLSLTSPSSSTWNTTIGSDYPYLYTNLDMCVCFLGHDGGGSV